MLPRFSQQYKPLYFLAALGSGGLSVTFFMYLMFLVKHPNTPIPTFTDLHRVYTTGGAPQITLVTVAGAGIAYFAISHLRLLAANLLAYRVFKKTAAYQELRSSNAEVSLMAIPLTLAMTINVLFIVGALTVPGLWDFVEYLFPWAMVGFTAVGVLALNIFGRYLGRLLTHRGLNESDVNHFSQALPTFAFFMIAVGFAAPAAMSHHLATSIPAMFASAVFLTAGLAWAALAIPVSAAAMLTKGAAKEAAPTLWIGIPILTLFGITFIRLGSGLSHNLLHTNLNTVLALVVLGVAVAMQLVIALGGYAVMRRQQYLATYVSGDKHSIAAYGLVCPGVALMVLGMFFVHWGLVKNGVIDLFSVPHLVLVAVLATLQVATIALTMRLHSKLLGTRPQPSGSAVSTSAHAPA